MWYNKKMARKSSKRAHLLMFTPHFSKFVVFRMLLNGMCFPVFSALCGTWIIG